MMPLNSPDTFEICVETPDTLKLVSAWPIGLSFAVGWMLGGLTPSFGWHCQTKPLEI
jgi:hypothetical protein